MPPPSAESLLEHAGFLHGLARSLVFDDEQARDVVQDAMVVALEQRPRHPSKLRAWMAGIVRRLALKSLRTETRRTRRERTAAGPDGLPPTGDVVARLEMQRRVVEEVRDLPEPYRSTLVHRYFDDRGPAEIARLTGVPVRTVETRLRRGLERLRERLDADHGGDRRAWCLALVAALGTRIPTPIAAAGPAAAVAGAVMSTKAATLVAAAAFAATGFFAGYLVKGRTGPAPSERGTAGREATVPLAEHQKLSDELAEAKAKAKELQRELDAVRPAGPRTTPAAPEAGVPDGEQAPPAVKGLRFAYAGTREALGAVDWDTVGESLHAMPPLMAELAEALANGDELPASVGEIQRWNGPLLKEAIKMQQAGVGGTGLNGVFSNPAVMVNMVHAALAKSDKPLTEDQQKRLYEIGLRYSEEEQRREAGYDEGALGLRKLVDETAVKDRFFQEVNAVLGAGQMSALRPEATRDYAGLDLFSTGIMYSGMVRPVAAKDAADLESTIVGRVIETFGIDAAQRAVVEDVARTYVQQLPQGFLDAPMPGGRIPLITMDRVRTAGRLQARLLEDLQGRLALTDAQLARLRKELVVLVPYGAP